MAGGACKVILCSYQEFGLEPPHLAIELCVRDACKNPEIAGALEGLPARTFERVIQTLEKNQMGERDQRFMVDTLLSLGD